MTKRPLTETERKITEKNLQSLKEELEYVEKVKLPQKRFILDTADIVFKRQIKEVDVEVKRISKDMEELKAIIRETEKQITEGVEIKKISK